MRDKERSKQSRRILKNSLLIVCGFLGGTLVLAAIALVLYVSRMPELYPWHTAQLDEEFSANSDTPIQSFQEYLELEDRLFEQLDRLVHDKIPPHTKRKLNRFNPGSWSDPASRPVNWNRTIELKHQDPIAGVLLIHGTSDSPYSMRGLAQMLHKHGAHVVCIRLPGNGTAPVGLTQAVWQDMAAPVRLAAKHLRQTVGNNTPFYIVGYSTGGTLAIDYSLSVMEGENTHRPDGLILFSPAVALSPTAALAKWNLRLSRLPGMGKAAWLDIFPEYDPFKYNSFPVNAGDIVYQLTLQVRQRMRRLNTDNGIPDFPPTLVFQTVTDATVSWKAAVDDFLTKLAPNKHRLVLFDVNRESETLALLATDPMDDIKRLLSGALPFDLTLITNANPDSNEIVAKHKTVNSTILFQETLDLSWPPGVFALSHVALPFPPSDPLYGLKPDNPAERFTLGTIPLRGELDQLQVPIGLFLRLRYNPFFEYVQRLVIERLPNQTATDGMDHFR